jgi:hypothetical protein
MANVMRDPRDHPDAITPDLAKGGPLVTFTVSDVPFVYGSKWMQRYFKKGFRAISTSRPTARYPSVPAVSTQVGSRRGQVGSKNPSARAAA